MSRILCAWSPSWAIANWRRRNPSDSPAEPFALIETVRAVRRLSAVSETASRLGLSVGQKATDAMALVPELTTAEAEPEADATALTALGDWCVRFSPAVAIDAPDGLFLDVTGVDHLWGGEAALLEDIRRRLAANGLPFRAAIADTPGAAWALAHYGEDGAIAPPGGQGPLLAPLRPAALRFDQETWAQIERLGLRQAGQLMAIPRGPFARRFGRGALLRLDQALGREAEALEFRRPPTPWFARLAFAEPISEPEDLARVAFDVAAKLCARLEAENQGARRFEIAFHRLDGKTLPLQVGLTLPGRDARRIAKLFAPKLETVDPGFGIEVVTITAEDVEPISSRQARLDTAREATVEEGLAPLVDRLVNRLGEDRVWRAAPVESHVPELAVGRARPLSKSMDGAKPKDKPRPWDPTAPRPARLFRRPEPVDMVLAITPDDPPSQFRWRGQVHRVRRAEGPERIGEEWWKAAIEDADTRHVRDYYRVEDAEGARFWLFRAGLYGDPAAPPQWWLHGVFG
ncbi:DNA polymerase Y family protein [Phenylobacterium sp.]|uniref:Y-family DNA polymerase n=1 Tax=Phenylobacterium sp. TaxID=1871053 RepID=UPI0012192140|nr:DNA polymerase Y family protein [Phenylobacterium sp.]THD61885.1 MAG: DNA polymerase Y family protein [Phenylobacterium sp.]